MRYFAVLLISVFVAIGLAATTLMATPPAAKAAGGGDVERCGGGTIFLNADEKQTLALHNSERRDRDLKALCVHPDLQSAARAHSKNMIRRDYFSHNTKGRREGACERINRYGHPDSLPAENIAHGFGPYGEPGSIMDRRMKSDVHRRNILNGRFREVGIGTHTGTYKGTQNVTMYTADFGTRR